MTLKQVMAEIVAKGDPQTKKTFMRHGAKEPVYGVKIGELKTIQKKIKGDQALAMQLYDTGCAEAQYLAGMVADGKKMTPAQLQKWVETAVWSGSSGTTCVWVASEHPDGLKLALQWIDSDDEKVATTGWNTLSALAAIVPDDKLPVKQYSKLLDRIAKTLKTAPNCVKYTMNGFIIACGTYIAELGEKAIATARKVGKVEVDMGDTACKVPDAEPYIIKSRRGNSVAAKRKTTRC
jgi:3-methyladenine DNA glycosylase AlkD